ncbi:MAG: hypothetical protein CL440_06765 [Acidimicrobiaceae bacterium]|nr:hypothetical protein [Acidimicrobiaceae bacterium]
MSKLPELPESKAEQVFSPTEFEIIKHMQEAIWIAHNASRLQADAEKLADGLRKMSPIAVRIEDREKARAWINHHFEVVE